MRLESKVALVSGAAGGIGEAVARRFVAEGARVGIGDIDEAGAQALAQELCAQGASAIGFGLDVTQAAHWQAAVTALMEAHGRLDTLVNNAGVYQRRGLQQISEADWDLIMDVNAKGVFLGSKAVIEPMRMSGGGSIINISSTAGIRGSLSTHYGASKGAVRLMSKSIAVHHARDGIRCNSVHPGPIATKMGYEAVPEAVRADRLAHIPIGRFGEPAEIASAVLFLASDDASFVTGTELIVDGGATAA